MFNFSQHCTLTMGLEGLPTFRREIAMIKDRTWRLMLPSSGLVCCMDAQNKMESLKEDGRLELQEAIVWNFLMAKSLTFQ